MPAVDALSKSSLAQRGTKQVLGEDRAGVAASVSRMHRTLASEAEFWLSSERSYVERNRGLGDDARPLAAVEGR